VGRGVPSPSHIGVWRSVVKWILCIFEVRKKPSGTPFSVFFSDGGAPKIVARENFPPFPLSTGLLLSVFYGAYIVP